MMRRGWLCMLWYESLSVSPASMTSWIRGVDLPSERNIQARRKVNRFGNCLISLGLIISPTRLQPWPRPIPLFDCPLLCPFGRPIHAGIVKTAHQIALTPTARRSEDVVPPINVTGMIKSAKTDTPAKKPNATPIDEIRDIVKDSTAL